MNRRFVLQILIICASLCGCVRGEEDLSKLPSLKVWLKPNPGDAKGVLNAANKAVNVALNATTWEPGGKFGRVLQFDGEQGHVMITSNVKDTFTEDCITVGGWINARGEGVILTELGGAQLNPPNWHDGQMEVESDGEIKVRVWNLNPVSLGKIKFNEWHHVMMRYNRKDSTVCGFLDGAKAAATTTGNREWNGNNPIFYDFGGTEGTNMGSGEFFDGYMDDLRIYNAALSDAQIKTLAQGAPAAMPVKVRVPKPLPSTPGHHVMKFSYKASDRTIQLAYLLYLPKNYDKSKDNCPLLLFLHGAGECGTDCNALYIHGPNAALRNDAKFGDTYPFIGVSPQCPPGTRWDSPEVNKAVVAIIDYISSNYRVDKDRVYATGLSMGGKGTWLVAHAAPDHFAACAPISAVEVEADKALTRFKNMALWIICGAEDGGFTEGSKKMASVLKDSPSDVKLTVFPHEGHGVWMRYYPGQELYQWLLTHHRGATAAPAVTKSPIVAAAPALQPAIAPAPPAPPKLSVAPAPAPVPPPAPAPEQKTVIVEQTKQPVAAPEAKATVAQAEPAPAQSPGSVPYVPITLSLAALLMAASMYLFFTAPAPEAKKIPSDKADVAEVAEIEEIPTVGDEMIVEAAPPRPTLRPQAVPSARVSPARPQDGSTSSTIVMTTPKFPSAALKNSPAPLGKAPASEPRAQALPQKAVPAGKPVAARPVLQKTHKPTIRRYRPHLWLLGAALSGLALGGRLEAANEPAPLPQVQGQHKLSFDYKDGDVSIKVPYLLYLPKDYDKSKDNAPLLVFLHGVGEMGSDHNGLFIHGPSAELERAPARKDKFPFIILSPQASTKRWEDPQMVKAVVALIDFVSKTWRVDKDRTYLTGLSMGGRGTWEVSLAAPDRFAAIAPISAIAVQPEHALEKLKDLSIWIICGGADGGFTEGSKKMAEILKPSKQEVKLTVHDGEGHGVWGHYYPDPKFYDWFLTHRKTPPPAAKVEKIEKPPSPPPAAADDTPAHMTGLSARMAALAPKCRQKTQMKLLGKSEDVTVVGVDDKGLKVEWSGNSTAVRWKDVDPVDCARIGFAICSDDAEALFHAGALAGSKNADALYNRILEKLRKVNASKAEELIGIVKK